MKTFVVVSCLLAVASAGYLGPVGYSAGHGSVLGHDGHPVDTAEVAHAKAAHFAAVAEANARIGSIAPHAHHAAPASYASHYNGPQHIPVIGPLGVPLETPEVVAAKAANAAAHAKANGAANHYGYDAPAAHGNYGYAPVAQHYAAAPAHGVLGHDGHPVDTPEVAHAKAAHYAAVAEANSRAYAHPQDHHRYRRGLINAYASPLVHSYASPLAYSGLAAHSVLATPYAVAHSYAGPQHLPVIGANGVPLDTPEVAAGKVANAVAHAEAHARNGDHAIVTPLAYGHGLVAHGLVAPVAHYATAHHVPAIGHNGVPLDTPEVAVAKAHHAAAHIEAQARNLVHHY